MASGGSSGAGVEPGEAGRELVEDVELPSDVVELAVSPPSVDSVEGPAVDVGSSVVDPEEELGVGAELDDVDDSGALLEEDVFEELLEERDGCGVDGCGVDEGAGRPGRDGDWSSLREDDLGVLDACGRSEGETRGAPVVVRVPARAFDVLVDVGVDVDGVAPAGADSVPLLPPEPPAADNGLPSTLPATAPSW